MDNMENQRLSDLVRIAIEAPPQDEEPHRNTPRQDKAFDDEAIEQRKQDEESTSPIIKERLLNRHIEDMDLMGEIIKKYVKQKSGITLKGNLGFEGLTLSLNPWYRKPTAWTQKQGMKVRTLTHAEMVDTMKRLIRDTKAYAKKNNYIFQSICVLSDWHHGKGNGRDLHFHLIFFGIPKGVIPDYVVRWWTSHGYGYKKWRKDDKSKGTVRNSRSIDFGWVTYCRDNAEGSTQKCVRWFGNGWRCSDWFCFGRRWTLWGSWLPPKGTRDKNADEGEVDNDDFEEFEQGVTPCQKGAEISDISPV